MSRAPLGMFEGFGIELEYMIVDRATLAVKPICDQVLRQLGGELTNEVECGPLRISNELVLHVIELKTNGPAPRLEGLAAQFQQGMARINRLLEAHDACLLPTAMHPWMDPHRETRLWPHDNGPIYAAYNRIFDCQGHGWSNLQSIHINLPFADDAEFGRLHAAIRLLLPLLPALAASSPLVEGQATGLLDNRLAFYRDNQKRIPVITGRVIPEAVFTPADYQREVLEAIYRAIAPFDPQGILQEEWLNSRGAIARFERNAIEIRLLDVQECPLADLAVVSLVVASLRALAAERWQPLEAQQRLGIDDLEPVLTGTMRYGELAPVAHPGWLACLGLPPELVSAGEIWQHLARALWDELPPECRAPLSIILDHGPLARRILRTLPENFTQQDLHALYGRLAQCSATGSLFRG